jgi:hypothetical protein
MGYNHFRFARRVDADVMKFMHGTTELIRLDKGTANITKLTGRNVADDSLYLYGNAADGPAQCSIRLAGDNNMLLNCPNIADKGFNFYVAESTLCAKIRKEGVLHLLETTTPTAVTNMGAFYTKNDNKAYFQDGAGTEHTLAFV